MSGQTTSTTADYILEVHKTIRLKEPLIGRTEFYRSLRKHQEYVEGNAVVPPVYPGGIGIQSSIDIASLVYLGDKFAEDANGKLGQLPVLFAKATDLPPDSAIWRGAQVSLAFNNWLSTGADVECVQLDALVNSFSPIERGYWEQSIRRVLAKLRDRKHAVPFGSKLKLFPSGQVVKAIPRSGGTSFYILHKSATPISSRRQHP